MAILVIIFLLIGVRLFQQSADPDAEDIADAWNRSISRLGILPVFPPEEDIHVGDIWAVISDAKNDDKNDELKPILGKAVRVGHLDLRQEARESAHGRPIFAETMQPTKELPFRKQDRKEVARPEKEDSLIALTLAAFPGITITHTKRASGTLGSLFGGLGLGSDSQQSEEIRIPVAETYGVSAAEALLKLEAFCKKDAGYWCKDENIRTIASYALTPRVLHAAKGQYSTNLQLRLITRVFLTREIVHRYSQNFAGAGAVQVSKEAINPAPDGVTARDAADNKDASPNTVARSANTGAANRTPSGGVSASRGDSAEAGLREVFQRPIVFGYRAVTMIIPPGSPVTNAPSSTTATNSGQPKAPAVNSPSPSGGKLTTQPGGKPTP